jgi:predicted XRE-type DNA-binding protein
MKKQRAEIERGSGNVFADIGLPNAEEHLLKAELVSRVDDLIKERKLTQAAAGQLLGVGQPDLSKILRGHFQEISVARLLRFLLALDSDVEIILKRNKSKARPSRITIRAA